MAGLSKFEQGLVKENERLTGTSGCVAAAVLARPACAYLRGGFAGQAFTEWTCEACEKPQPMWRNTATPKLCLECADR